ncbi:MAG: dihydrodipicolinate synthase family protein [Planctomycetes bacterium]|nr:dihydrodipicolinate synthase family protein [Planctomycetota bacterium]
MTEFDWIAAPHTPFDPRGDLALDVVAQQAAHLRAAGVTGVLIAGSTGEGSSLTGDERRALAQRWAEQRGSLQLWVHVGHNSTREAAALARHAASIGAHGICAAPPSWFGIGDHARLVATCAEVAAGAPELPFLYYHIPALSHVTLSMAPFAREARARIPNFAGIKFTHLDALDFQACRREHGDAVRLYWGCDEQVVTGLALGAHGAVGSTYNFAMPVYRRLLLAFRDGDLESARQLQSYSAQLVERLAAHGYLAAAKATMKYLGVDVGSVREPIPPLAPDGEAAVFAELDRLELRRHLG